MAAIVCDYLRTTAGARTKAQTAHTRGWQDESVSVSRMHDTRDLYELLQVRCAADSSAIEVAYKRLARRFHPDVNGSADATEMMQRLNEAYAVLRDPGRRAAYDRRRYEEAWAKMPPLPAELARRPPHAGAGRGHARRRHRRQESRERWAARAPAWSLESMGIVLFLLVLIALSGPGRLLHRVFDETWSWAAGSLNGESREAPATPTPDELQDRTLPADEYPWHVRAEKPASAEKVCAAQEALDDPAAYSVRQGRARRPLRPDPARGPRRGVPVRLGPGPDYEAIARSKGANARGRPVQE